jgi:UPF0716 family protein affecting phage T7 exclusion
MPASIAIEINVAITVATAIAIAMTIAVALATEVAIALAILLVMGNEEDISTEERRGEGRWRKLHNEELHDLYSSPGIIRIMNARRGM